MAKGNRPAGRQKRVGSGGGGVFRRGPGLSGATGGPVGETGGYADRRGDATAAQEGGPSRGIGDHEPASGGAPGGGAGPGLGGLPVGGGCVRIAVVLGVILLVIYVVFRLLAGEGGLGGRGSAAYESAASRGAMTYVDRGAYDVSTTVSDLARPKRTSIRGGGKDTVTVMVYMCGTDLESEDGMATADLDEMLYAEISDKVNIIVETGGTSAWQNSVISSKTNQRYRVTSQGLELLEKSLGKRSMVDPDTLSDFIRYCETEYPADRYMLVLWDHGGGSLTGYGYDQYYPRDSMTLHELGTALKEAGCAFDLVGFDACLMGTLETGIVLEPYSDYMIASEEVEPGIGWYYTGWITALSENSSIPTTDLGKRLLDDYVTQVKAQTSGSQATLSLVDLAEFKGTVPPALAAFSTASTELIDSDRFQAVSDARAGAKEFASSSEIDQIDLVHFAVNLETDEGDAMADVLRGCIKYNRTTTNITNANGVAIYFPYGTFSRLNSMLKTYEQIGIGEEYAEFISSYASVAAGGQVVSPGRNNMLDTLLSGQAGSAQTPTTSTEADAAGKLLETFLASGDYSSITGLAGDELGWLDVDRMQASTDYYDDNRLDASALAITEKGGQRVLALSEEQWNLVQYMEMNVFLDDGEGFIDLGLDNVYEFNRDGDLVMEYDGTWLALNGRVVSYYLESDDHDGDAYSIKGRVPALLNGQLVDIILDFTDQDPYGKVLGARKRYDPATESETLPKGLIEIVAGDTIDFLCDYYTYEGAYSDTYKLGDQYTATGQWVIENLSVGDGGYQMTYRITDIYGNRYWTPSISD